MLEGHQERQHVFSSGFQHGVKWERVGEWVRGPVEGQNA